MGRKTNSTNGGAMHIKHRSARGRSNVFALISLVRLCSIDDGFGAAGVDEVGS
jgi:hypothetical protein